MKDLRPGAAAAAVRVLEQRVADLEADLADVRRHNVRLAEIVDVVQELLVPMASRDEATVRAALERFRSEI